MTVIQLGDAIELRYGKALLSADRNAMGEWPVFGSAGQVGVHSETLVSEPTIVVGRKGSVGSITFAPRGGWVIDTAFYTVPRCDVDLRFLDHQLRHLRLGQHAITTSIPGLNREDAYKRNVFLPEKDEQRQIAAILDKADAVRARRRTALADADALARATFLRLFGDPVTNPMRWPVRPLAELCRIRRGASPRPISKFIGGTVPWFRIGDATGEHSSIYLSATADHVTEEGAAKSVRLEPGAMIFANCGVSLGFARIVTIEGCIHDGWLAFDRFDAALNQRFLLTLVNVMTQHLRAIAPDGTQPNLNTKIMGALGIILPPRELQERFLSMYERVEAVHAAAVNALADADAFYASLAARAFRGEL